MVGLELKLILVEKHILEKRILLNSCEIYVFIQNDSRARWFKSICANLTYGYSLLKRKKEKKKSSVGRALGRLELAIISCVTL
jgi:hypothetical protein